MSFKKINPSRERFDVLRDVGRLIASHTNA
jgi:hypothetical protein